VYGNKVILHMFHVALQLAAWLCLHSWRVPYCTSARLNCSQRVGVGFAMSEFNGEEVEDTQVFVQCRKGRKRARSDVQKRVLCGGGVMKERGVTRSHHLQIALSHYLVASRRLNVYLSSTQSPELYLSSYTFQHCDQPSRRFTSGSSFLGRRRWTGPRAICFGLSVILWLRWRSGPWMIST
jgi:hypothetical protein